MAKSVKPLNDKQIKNAKPKDKEYNLSDGQGLLLRVKPNGSKLWLFNYTNPHSGKRKNLSLGAYQLAGSSDVIVTLSDARELRTANLRLLAENKDPISYRNNERIARAAAENNTFFEVARGWKDIHSTRISPETSDKIWRLLEKYAFPDLGKIPVDQITAPIAKVALQRLVNDNKLETSRKLARRLNNIMTYAVNSGFVQHNPLAGLRELIPHAPVKNMVSIKPSELPELMHKLSIANIKLVTRCLIEFQLHTMVRPIEAATAKWAEIDLVNKVWTIPPEKMKMRREHVVPLSLQVIALLDVMRPISGNREYIFPADRDPKGHANSETANSALKKRMGFRNRLVAHGLRALASTTLNEQHFDADVIEAALAHTDPDRIRGTYNRAQYLEKRREMMCWWSEHIQKAATGNMSLSGGIQI